ncbi:amidohydrolase family protein [Virgisporangium aurantiacum]|uniref:4-hydroxyphenyl-beta-ketoacyl-CoA hydrolase n=1 Tax=Virgisporangium aurantiacum TaxID=175570 RepID=A0A8J3ZFV7_9ACTN|nr:amidohydrolase family protein [Virgisporangium aurantiacum]GIJ60845.1 4-hydroxyphenyl-beta-ketoacyl-CoA hydrolase [Virgisporangium aurantiacum]
MLDVHTHCHLPEHWGCEWSKNWQPVYGHEYAERTPEQYDEAMAAAGVDLAFVFGMRATRAGVITPNEHVEKFCTETSTPTLGFMALDLSDPDVLDQLADGVTRGLRGVKLYPILAHFDARDEAHDRFFAAATAANLVVLWHMGATPSPEGRLELSNPLLVDDVARRHPELTQIIAHMGHPWQRETMVVLRKSRNVFADVSAAWARPYDGHRALLRAQEWGVVDKLLFGSDYPMWTPAEAVAGLRALTGVGPGIEPATIEWLVDGDPRAALGVNR